MQRPESCFLSPLRCPCLGRVRAGVWALGGNLPGLTPVTCLSFCCQKKGRGFEKEEQIAGFEFLCLALRRIPAAVGLFSSASAFPTAGGGWLCWLAPGFVRLSSFFGSICLPAAFQWQKKMLCCVYFFSFTNDIFILEAGAFLSCVGFGSVLFPCTLLKNKVSQQRRPPSAELLIAFHNAAC